LTGYLLDTNVLSELVRKRPAEQVIDRLKSIPPEFLTTSSVCVMELRYGAARHPQGNALWKRISEEVLPRVRIVPLGPDEAERAGDLISLLESQGSPIGLEDILIGATALTQGFTMVTRNLKHFERIDGLAVESWWA
jgi:tRNA(fMet)-specific endonuclease VapC